MLHMPPPSKEELANSVKLGHEPSTVSIKGVFWFFIWFFGFCAVVMVIMYVMFDQLVKYQLASNEQKSAINNVDVYPPEPMLQPTKKYHERTDAQDLKLMHQTEDEVLIERGWQKDEKTGVFEIPQDRIAAGFKLVGTTVANPASGGSGAGMPQ